jgi:hypothetical protein
MVETVKFCQMCGCEISNLDEETTNFWKHCAVMYCPECRKESDRQKTLARVHELRKRKKQKDKYRDAELLLMQERLKLMEEENALLRKRIQREREEKPRQSTLSR